MRLIHDVAAGCLRWLGPVALLGLIASCAPAFPAPAMPRGLQPATAAQVTAWAAVTVPRGHRDLPFSWKYRDPDQNVGGRGAVKTAGPDSVRLDFRGPLGSGSGAAVVVGDTATWADPPDEIDKLVPNYPLLWAMLGVARAPAGTWTVTGREDPSSVAWRYARGADTVDYLRTLGGTAALEVSFRHAGKLVGRVVTMFRVDGRPAQARLDVPATPARLDIRFDAAPRRAAFDRDMWNAPSDH